MGKRDKKPWENNPFFGKGSITRQKKKEDDNLRKQIFDYMPDNGGWTADEIQEFEFKPGGIVHFDEYTPPGWDIEQIKRITTTTESENIRPDVPKTPQTWAEKWAENELGKK